jgi:TolB-like protein/DNA-binding winged helix-turn-helix (wHTH) protein/Tfp pilus assembly protein PilF
MLAPGKQVRRYRFGAFVIDEQRGALQRNGEEVPLRPKSWEVLRQLVIHRGELVTKHALLDAVWQDRVVSEGVVAKSVREIRQALGDEARRMVRTVPRRGYLFDPPVVEEDFAHETARDAGGKPGHSEADDLAAADITPIPPGESARPRGRPAGRSVVRPWRGAALATILLAAIAAVWNMAPRNADSSSGIAPGNALERADRSIAVLPFADMSPDGSQLYLADGMAEEILNLLAAGEELTVIARTSSFAFRDEPVDVVTISRRLNVAYLLEGSLRRNGDRLRVGVQLVDGRDGTRMWSASYERTLDDAFTLQSEIAEAVRDQLHVRLADTGDRRLVDPAAYQRYLEARFLFNRRMGDDLQRAEALFLEATEIDPDFARAWAGLAGVYWVRSDIWLDDSIRLSPPEALEAMAGPVQRALRADPDLAEAHVRAGIYFGQTGDPDRARDHLKRAHALAPNDPLVLASIAWNFDESTSPATEMALYRRIIAVDPLSLIQRNNFVVWLIGHHRLDEARTELQTIYLLFPASIELFAYVEATIALLDGDFDDAAAAAERIPDTNAHIHERTALMAMAWAATGQTERAAEVRKDLESTPGEWAALRVAEIHAHAGAEQEAFAWLREVGRRLTSDHEYRRNFWSEVELSPFFFAMKDDPRWDSLQDQYEALSASLHGSG